jgi:hypothetical protein
MDREGSSEILANIYQTTRRHILATEQDG